MYNRKAGLLKLERLKECKECNSLSSASTHRKLLGELWQLALKLDVAPWRSTEDFSSQYSTNFAKVLLTICWVCSYWSWRGVLMTANLYGLKNSDGNECCYGLSRAVQSLNNSQWPVTKGFRGRKRGNIGKTRVPELDIEFNAWSRLWIRLLHFAYLESWMTLKFQTACLFSLTSRHD